VTTEHQVLSYPAALPQQPQPQEQAQVPPAQQPLVEQQVQSSLQQAQQDTSSTNRFMVFSFLGLAECNSLLARNERCDVP
jgi:hypothetical protein